VFLAPLSETPKENIFWIVNGKVKLFRLSWISVVFHLYISLFLLLIIHLSVFFSFGFLFCIMWIQYWIPLNWTTNRFWRHDSWCPGNWIICVSLIMRSFVFIYIYKSKAKFLFTWRLTLSGKTSIKCWRIEGSTPVLVLECVDYNYKELLVFLEDH
jgi:hypothetical protein